MRILMISAEAPPLQRTGALIDVMNALPHKLRARGHEISVALPFYREIREKAAFKAKDTGVTVDVHVGKKTYIAGYLEGRSASGVQLFLIRCDKFFDRPGIYGEQGKPYEDNAERFIFFFQSRIGTRAAIDALAANSARPRLGGSAGASLCARAPSAIRNGANDPSPS